MDRWAWWAIVHGVSRVGHDLVTKPPPPPPPQVWTDCSMKSHKVNMSNFVIFIVSLLFSHPVVSDSLRPHGLQHNGPPCPSPSPEVCPISCPLHQWCHPALSFSGAPFSFCPQSFPASGTFPMSWLFSSGNQNTGASALTSVLPMSIQGWFPLRLTSLIFLLCKGLSGVFSSTTVWRHQFFGALPSLWSSSHSHMTTGKTTALTIQTFVGKEMSLLFNTLSRFVITFLVRSNHLLKIFLMTLTSLACVQSFIDTQGHFQTFPIMYCRLKSSFFFAPWVWSNFQISVYLHILYSLSRIFFFFFLGSFYLALQDPV